MVPKVSLSRSQETATGPYPDPNEYSSHPQNVSLIFILILSSHLRLVSHVVSSLQFVSELKFCMHFASLLCVLQAPPIASPCGSFLSPDTPNNILFSKSIVT